MAEKHAHSGLACVAFTDGACVGNPGPGGWAAVLLLPGGRVVELGGSPLGPGCRPQPTTNNRMELQAAIEAIGALGALAPGGAIEVLADSSYVVSGATRWLAAWKRRGWVRPDGAEVANQDLWKLLDAILSAAGPGRVRWARVKGHAGVPGNCRADAIALSFAEGRPAPLYNGPLSGYGHDLSDRGTRADAEDMGRDASGRRGGPGSPRPEPGFPVYLSLVAGSLVRHATWKECESVVRGVSGARFKKVRTSAEERETLRGWGLQRA
ncbi:MAG: RNase H family protein [Elusimicrobiota bacterium]|jgi:ribonuclease HI